MTNYHFSGVTEISIHALLAESAGTAPEVGFVYYISIHALLAESDTGLESMDDIIKSFLSTLSLRRATPKGSVHDFKLEEFLSTLSLRRATDNGCLL